MDLPIFVKLFFGKRMTLAQIKVADAVLSKKEQQANNSETNITRFPKQ